MKRIALALGILALTACSQEPENNQSSVTVQLPPAKPAAKGDVKRNDVGEIEAAEDGFDVGNEDN